MKKLFLSLAVAVQFAGNAFAQETTEIKVKAETENTEADGKNPSPYSTKFAVDGTISLVGIGLNGLGLYLIQENKHGPTSEELAAIDADLEGAKRKINAFDRFSAGNFSMEAKKASDYPFYGSFAAPLLLLLDEESRRKAGQIGVLYVETMAITGALFTMSVAHVERNRPLVYNNDADNTERTKKHAQNSFYAGHTAAAASATFFAAKIFHDFNPDSGLRPVVWIAAAAVPATVGYLRLEAGKHFLSDNILGYAIGAGAGILVPTLHKKGVMDGVSLMPVMGPYNGLAARVTF